MSNDIIFYTQIISLSVFVLALFGIYRSLVANKDSLIELQKERIDVLAEKINELESQTSDALAESLSSRVERQLSEIERLRADGTLHEEEIELKESEVRGVQEQLSTLAELMKDYDLVCPKCGAPLERREHHTLHGYSGGREVETDVEFLEYACGAASNPDGTVSPCAKYKS
ncbi:hypothetical protein AB4876_05445 [Zhongshania guokunii]|uniref:C2H2-type domain-containing protein n=1 Tax=Zhongshania guokunii TaxID=641783 RepID=A0ABV3U356_9GAMM